MVAGSSKSDHSSLSLKDAREQNRLAEFIEQHSGEQAENEEFTRLLERVERDQKTPLSRRQK